MLDIRLRETQLLRETFKRVFNHTSHSIKIVGDFIGIKHENKYYVIEPNSLYELTMSGCEERPIEDLHSYLEGQGEFNCNQLYNYCIYKIRERRAKPLYSVKRSIKDFRPIPLNKATDFPFITMLENEIKEFSEDLSSNTSKLPFLKSKPFSDKTYLRESEARSIGNIVSSLNAISEPYARTHKECFELIQSSVFENMLENVEILSSYEIILGLHFERMKNYANVFDLNRGMSEAYQKNRR